MIGVLFYHWSYFFFFKQKTAYEMRISDWSSDVCSSDLDPDAVVAVIDGDTLLEPGVVNKTAPFFKLMPGVGGLTTNEFCKVDGSYVMSEWHKLRFAQRHLNMSSIALTRRVLTPPGRLSLFRCSTAPEPLFLDHVQKR